MKTISCMMLGAVAMFAMAGCAENAQPKSPADFDPNAPAPPPTATAAVAPTAAPVVPPMPEAPKPLPPSAIAPVVVELNGTTTPVKDGSTYPVGRGDMLMFYASGASADCSNVNTSLISRPNVAGMCQMMAAPIEMKLKAGQLVEQKIAISNGPAVSFTILVL